MACARGFINVELGLGTAGFDIASIKDMREFMSDMNVDSPLETNNVFTLDLAGATWRDGAFYSNGRITKQPRYVRDQKVLPLMGVIEFLVNILQRESKLPGILARLEEAAAKHAKDADFMFSVMNHVTLAMEAMITDGWVKASYDPSLPLAPVGGGSSQVRWNRDQK